MTDELRIVVRAREDSARSFAGIGEIVRNGAQMVQAAETMRAIVAVNEIQVGEILSNFRRVLEQYQVDFEAMRAAMQTLLKAYTMPVFPRYALDFSSILTPYYLDHLGRPSATVLERLQANRPQPLFGPVTSLSSGTEEATMPTGTASVPDVFGDVDSPDAALDEIDLLFDEALQENDNFRLYILKLQAEIRGYRLSAAMGWATLPYPRLKPEDFDDLERQP